MEIRAIKTKKLPLLKTTRKKKQKFPPVMHKRNQRNKNNNNQRNKRRKLRRLFQIYQSLTLELERSLNALQTQILTRFTWKRLTWETTKYVRSQVDYKSTTLSTR